MSNSTFKNFVPNRFQTGVLVCLTLVLNLGSYFVIKMNPQVLLTPEHNDRGPLEYKRPRNNATKQILFWNAPGWMLGTLYHPYYKQLFSKCEVNKCVLTRDRNLLSKSDAVVFYGFDKEKQIPKKPTEDQVWIFTMWESPYYSYSNTHHFDKPEFHNQFNWTMTYRLDSDIHVPYGVVKKIKPVKKNYDEILKKKTKLIAWVVSDCSTQSKREHYVSNLQKAIPVDSFGWCNRNKQNNIFSTIHETYKFYLSFENSLCKDYVTEKFLDRQNLNTVPIVRGDGNYTHFYPKDSFIDTNDFKTIDELAEYLLYLDKNDTEYTKYLKAKEGYDSLGLTVTMRQGYCDMCRMLQSADKYQHIYHNVHKWWFSKNICRPATDVVLNTAQKLLILLFFFVLVLAVTFLVKKKMA